MRPAPDRGAVRHQAGGAGRIGDARGQARRPSRPTLPARRHLGGGGDEGVDDALLPAGPRRESLPPLALHDFEAHGSAARDGYPQRSEPRSLVRAPRPHQHAAAGARHAQRAALRRGVAAARRAGAARIVAVDIADKPLECARAMGADETINIAKQPEALAPFAVNKGVFDVMFEASGNDRALRNGLDVVAPRGVIVSIGLGGDSTLPLNQLVGKELELRGTFRFHEEFAVAVRFLNEGLIDGRPVISHVMDFDDAIHAFELASDKSQAMKVQINFGAEALV